MEAIEIIGLGIRQQYRVSGFLSWIPELKSAADSLMRDREAVEAILKAVR
jgi:hypothetical protein